MFSSVMVRREKDARFARVHTDPRFHRPRKDETKVVLDERFKDVLTKGPKQLDRFGRKRHDTREAQDLERLYRLDSDADYARGEVELESSSEEDDDDEEEEEDDDDESGDVVVGGADASGSLVSGPGRSEPGDGEIATTAGHQGVTVFLDELVRGVAPGQSVVLYDGTRVVGSATITSTARVPA